MQHKAHPGRGNRLNYADFVLTGHSKPKRRETAKERRLRQMRELSARLVSHIPLTEAAKSIGISPRSATRWLSLPQFSEAYVSVREASLENISRLLRTAALGAVQSLAEVSQNPTAAPTARASAAGNILAHLFKAVEVSELEAAVKRIEEATASAEESR